MHSDLGAFERIELLRDLREGRCEVLVGVNLLREGLDLPEVSLVAILDADKEGFLRSETSLIQTIGRAARNSNSKVILYADRITEAMNIAMEETARRRRKQEEYNTLHGITPETVRKAAMNSFQESIATRKKAREVVTQAGAPKIVTNEYLKELEAEMMGAAEEMEFERAAALRDEIQRPKEYVGKPLESVPAAPEKNGPQTKSRRGRRPGAKQ
jgi:excinuclease ABC subunit B